MTDENSKVQKMHISQSHTPKPDQRDFELFQRELSLLGYWRNRQRGNPAKGYLERGKNA